MVSIGKAILLTLGALTLLAAIVVGGYLGGWWLQNNSAQRQTHLIQHGDSAQTSYADAVENNLITIHSLDAQVAANPSLAGERIAVINQTCTIAHRIDSPAPDISAFISTDC